MMLSLPSGLISDRVRVRAGHRIVRQRTTSRTAVQ